jgi:hypothetical protein
MTNKLSLILGALILGAFCFDWIVQDGAATIFLGKKGILLIEKLIFWR